MKCCEWYMEGFASGHCLVDVEHRSDLDTSVEPYMVVQNRICVSKDRISKPLCRKVEWRPIDRKEFLFRIYTDG